MSKITVENVALVYVELPTSNSEQDLYELNELIATAQGDLKLTVTQKRNIIDPKTVVGKGKLDEIKRSVEVINNGEQDGNNVDVVIFSCPLNATQRATLTKALDCDVIDKIDLILDIFALRATSAEGKKQVELAQLSYNLATKPEGDFSRQGGNRHARSGRNQAGNEQTRCARQNVPLAAGACGNRKTPRLDAKKTRRKRQFYRCAGRLH